MIKTVLRLLLVLGLPTLVACGGVQSQVAIPAQQPIALKYASKADGQPVSDGEVLAAVANAIKQSSAYREVTEQPLKATPVSTPSADINEVSGLDVDIEGRRIRLTYTHGDHHHKISVRELTRSVAYYDVAVQQAGTTTNVTVQPPSGLNTTTAKRGMLLPISPLVTEEEAAADFARINAALKPTLSLHHLVKGELEVTHEDSSVFANFVRAFREGTDVEKTDIEKGQSFAVEQDGLRVEVMIKVYPYHGGSKVQYEFAVPYTLSSTGETSYDAGKVQTVVETVEKVARE